MSYLVDALTTVLTSHRRVMDLEPSNLGPASSYERKAHRDRTSTTTNNQILSRQCLPHCVVMARDEQIYYNKDKRNKRVEKKE